MDRENIARVARCLGEVYGNEERDLQYAKQCFAGLGDPDATITITQGQYLALRGFMAICKPMVFGRDSIQPGELEKVLAEMDASAETAELIAHLQKGNVS